ncbi:ninjurin-1-like isoform X2 [Hyposmocoma kahamanoa]|uniref:ninjurin-1-like isoform X2 n=1 Tax=Hyposmocoma kahamanoa TaxID=1477025 RepID=UPI000E6D7409|nr:ninjurin-1-like isoform X2 [Hyposmocoma kahamanoa]
MADENKDAASATSGSSEETRQVNIDEIISKMQDAPTEVICDIKGLDANRYATKKTVAQGMLDIALLTSNASQLKYVLQVGPKHEFYMLLVVLISISIVLQASAGVLALIISYMDGKHNEKQKKISDWLYHTSVGLMTGVVFCDVIKMTFGLDPALSEQDFLGNRNSSIFNFFSWKT